MLSELAIERTILARISKGDEKAFGQLYSVYYKKIYLFAWSFLKNKEQSEEVLQETFLKFWLSRDNLNIDLPAEPLLFTICRNLVMDSFRKTLRTEKQRLYLLNEMKSEHDNHTEDRIIYADLLRVAENAIAELPKQQQAVVRLSKLEGLSYDEISERLNISKHTVKNHLIVAMKTLRGKLGPTEICHVLLVAQSLKIYFDFN
jgi:RNA polymerase sigma-70 factor (family 1)